MQKFTCVTSVSKKKKNKVKKKKVILAFRLYFPLDFWDTALCDVTEVVVTKHAAVLAAFLA